MPRPCRERKFAKDKADQQWRQKGRQGPFHCLVFQPAHLTVRKDAPLLKDALFLYPLARGQGGGRLGEADVSWQQGVPAYPVSTLLVGTARGAAAVISTDACSDVSPVASVLRSGRMLKNLIFLLAQASQGPLKDHGRALKEFWKSMELILNFGSPALSHSVLQDW